MKSRIALLASLLAGVTFISVPAAQAEEAVLSPDGEGNYGFWTANSGSKADAVATDDGNTTYIHESTDLDLDIIEIQSFTFPGATVPDGATIHSVNLHVIARKTNASFLGFLFCGSGNTGSDVELQFIAEDGANVLTDVSLVGSDFDLTNSYEEYSENLTVNPKTGLEWTVDDVNNWAMNFGFRKNALTLCARVTQFSIVVDYTDESGGGIHGVRYKRQQFIRNLNNLSNPNHVNAPTPPAGFGGPEFFAGEQELTWEQLTAVCTVHDNLETLDSYDMIEYTAENFAHTFGVSEEFVLDIIENGTYCDAVLSARLEDAQLEAQLLAQKEAKEHAELMALYHMYQPKTVEVAVGEDGYPVSTDLVWNACIRNVEVYLPGEQKPVNCRRFHEGHTWTHPDTHLTFDWTDRVVKKITVPGYQVATYTVETPDYLVSDVRVVQNQHVVTKFVLPVSKYMALKGGDLLQQIIAGAHEAVETAVLSDREVIVD